MLQKGKEKNRLKKAQGITLVALVITIVILIILATVAVSYVFGENGIIGYADKEKDVAEANSQEKGKELTNMTDYSNELIEEKNEGKTQKIEDVKGGEAFGEKTKVVDSKENEIWVPAGFKIAEDSGNTVQQGIVIEDVYASSDVNVQGSQYVWIPVGTFTKDDGSTSGEIKLGRYTFDDSTGEPTLKQDAVNYMQSVVIHSFFSELSTYRQGIASERTDGLNATAKDLKGFIDSANANGGYYIGRYEASYASGAKDEITVENYAQCKAASKKSNGYSEYSMSYTPGTLWNCITQIDASKVAINTYVGSSSVKSDLINSYAWDTAIVYIQETENSNYVDRVEYFSLVDTGTNGDEVCKINDMALNLWEWTTEYSSENNIIGTYPCTCRGGSYGGWVYIPETQPTIGSFYQYSTYRDYKNATLSYDYVGFRLSLYL